MTRAPVIVLASVLAAAVAGAGVWWWTQASASGVSVDEIGDQVQTVARGALSVFAKGPSTGALYTFATERGDVLQWMPCTCGCADLGHGSNRACYIKQETAEHVTYTSHAAT